MTTLFGIKNCDTVKKARRWLEAENIAYNFHDFRSDGLNAEQVDQWIKHLGVDTLINKRSTTWKTLSDTEKETVMNGHASPLILEHPTLIKRPLLVTKSQFHVGFSEKTYTPIFLSPSA
jgi:arsenate reductase